MTAAEIAHQWLPVDSLQPHPKNPRLAMREDVIGSIAANLGQGFDPAHALIVRPVGGAYEIISGHHRLEAAKRAGMDSVPCWVRDMDDEAAYMALVTSNSQGELSPLEIGMHALHCVDLSSGGRGKKGGLSAYAEAVGKDQSNLTKLVKAAEVAEKVGNDTYVLHDKTAHLSAIHALPESCWQVVVEAMLSGGWSAKETGERVKVGRDFDAVDGLGVYTTEAALLRHFEYGDFSAQSYRRLMAQCAKVLNLIDATMADEQAAIERSAFIEWLRQSLPWNIADVAAYERKLEAAQKKSQITASGFKHGNWRDHIAEIPDNSVSLMLTDPPYGMDYQSGRRSERHDKIANDAGREAHAELADLLGAMQDKLAPDAHMLVFVDWRNEPAMRQQIEAAGYTLRGSLVWVKNNHGSGDLRGSFAPKHERILHAVRGNPALVKRIPDVLHADRANTDRHPTEKPVDLLCELVAATTVEGELVADPFAGVGSTLVAANNIGRAIWGCEISEKYHAAGVQRL